jgi:hydrogenase/urease accessory protein HupE
MAVVITYPLAFFGICIYGKILHVEVPFPFRDPVLVLKLILVFSGIAVLCVWTIARQDIMAAVVICSAIPFRWPVHVDGAALPTPANSFSFLVIPQVVRFLSAHFLIPLHRKSFTGATTVGLNL